MTWQDPYGPYGQNPQGQDPYGRQGWQQNTQPGWQDPYAAQPPHGQPQGYGYYGPPGAGGGASNGSALGALIANIAAAVLCCGGIAWLPGIILSAMAMSRAQTDPESSRQLSLWAWVCFALSIVLAIVLFVVLYAVGTFSTRTTTRP